MIEEKTNRELRSRYNPEGSELRNLQLRMVKMLDYFDKFCNDHDIRYWLASGSCLGAVRHQGFIPWDDDLDVEMLKEDYNKLLSLRYEFDNDDFVIQDHISDSEYITPFAKIRDLHSEMKEVHNRDNYFKFKGAFIDVFVRDNSSFVSSRISHIMQYSSYQLTNIRFNNLRLGVKSALFNLMHRVVFPILNFCDNLTDRSSLMRYSLGYGFYSRIDSNGLFPLKRIPFEDREYPVPGNYVDYLTRLYGDYMSLPKSVEDHRTHFKSIKLY